MDFNIQFKIINLQNFPLGIVIDLFVEIFTFIFIDYKIIFIIKV